MKYLLILADGMADYEIAELGNKTPLEYAQTPNMDYLAKTALIGKAATIPEGFPPGSDVANLAVMGYNPEIYYTGRSPLEAVSMGIELAETDLALRCNLVTLSDAEDYKDKIMLDYSSGEISSAESAELIKALQSELGNEEITFHPGISYRHLVIWKNALGKKIMLTPPHDISDQVVGEYLPAGSDSTVLLNLMLKSHSILDNHPVNQKRRASGQNPATSAWFWGEGKKPALDSFESLYSLKGSVVAAVDLVKGLGISAGLKSVEVEGATGAIETNFAGKARAALEELKQGQDFVYVHIESPDESGHQGSLKHKIWSIEQIDREVIGMVIEELDQFRDIRVMILPDHPTPLSIRTHSSDPVPFMIYDKNNPVSDSIGSYNEKSADQGIFFLAGYKLMEFFIKGR
jgi:2,3-bisphosphoglycerate-independent phosphoglycerate mutase